MKENIIQDILISLICKGILSTCPVSCSQYQSLNWAVWWECHVAVTAGDTWHKMRHGCVTEMRLAGVPWCVPPSWAPGHVNTNNEEDVPWLPALATITELTIQFYKCCSVTLSQSTNRTKHKTHAREHERPCTPTNQHLISFLFFLLIWIRVWNKMSKSKRKQPFYS